MKKTKEGKARRRAKSLTRERSNSPVNLRRIKSVGSKPSNEGLWYVNRNEMQRRLQALNLQERIAIDSLLELSLLR